MTSPTLHRLPDGRIASGAAMDHAGAPSWWSRMTGGRRVRAATMDEARERAKADAEALEEVCDG